MKSVEATHPADVNAYQSECEALVQRIVLSQPFQKAQKLREFLQYVCDWSLRQGVLDEVKEQQIGVHVFHRRPDYNMSEDSIVRVQAGELRKRLTTYFETEGKNESIIITIPKGGYIPVFVPAVSAVQDDPATQSAYHPETAVPPEVHLIDSKSPAGSRPAAKQISLILGGIVLLGIGWAIGTQSRQLSHQGSSTSVAQRSYSFYDKLLGPIGRDGHDTLLVLSNPRVILYLGLRNLSAADIHNRQFIPVPPALRQSLESARNFGEDPEVPTYLSIGNDIYTGIGEAACAFNIGRLMLLLDRPVQLTQGRFLNWDAAKREHLIVLGNSEINPWTRDNVAAHNFLPVEGGFRNLAPLPGEKDIYKTSRDASGRLVEDYGVISMSTTVSGSRVLTLAGRDGTGTYGTGDFFANPDKMKSAFDALNSRTHGKPFPVNWEVLVRVSIRDDIPVDTTFVTSRSNDPAR